ncbi:hypothetical protein SAMN05444672_12348 [Bacillus sp. OK838]|nr:hypothetical protein SAMN05444672_12348 [Bacillus sp. OK838]
MGSYCIPSGHNKGSEEENVKRWQLSLIGVGCTICTGFFSQLFGTYIVYSLLAKMTAEDPQVGSFCYYANKLMGVGSNLARLELLEFKHPPYGWPINGSFDLIKILVSKCSSLALCSWIRHSHDYCRFNRQ